MSSFVIGSGNVDTETVVPGVNAPKGILLAAGSKVEVEAVYFRYFGVTVASE